MARPKDPLLWGLFSVGGMLSAILFPAVAFVVLVAAPLGWAGTLEFSAWIGVVGHPAIRLLLLVVVGLSLHHAAHRLRYTLYDGLQLYHLDSLITVLTYGTALVLTLTAAAVLLVVG